MSNTSSNNSRTFFWAGAALAAVALTGGWTLAGKLFHTGDIEPSMVTASLAPDAGVSTSSFAERFNQRVTRAETNANFSDRFEPARRAPLAGSAPMVAPKQDRQQVAWFAPNSMGATPDRFARRIGEEPTVPAPAVKPQEVALMQPSPTVKQLIASIPMPNVRPQDAPAAAQNNQTQTQTAQAPTPKGGAFGHDALVQRARMALAAHPKTANVNIFDKLFGGGDKPKSGPMLAYAGHDGGVLSNGQDATPGTLEPSDMDRLTAVYDITAKRVYMPDGTKLEAHSGLGSRMDNPAYAHERMRGVTPPHIYDLKPREALFHGVAALRMTPLGGESAIFGRNGLLTHSYLLGPNGDSNGCISFKDYDKFLQAYRRGEVRRVVVVAKLD